MSLPLEVVLELYDYKITDLVNKRKPQGGFKSVLELRDVLKNAALNPDQHKKFSECSVVLAELVQEAILKKTQVESTINSALPTHPGLGEDVSSEAETNSVESTQVTKPAATKQVAKKPQSVPPLESLENLDEAKAQAAANASLDSFFLFLDETVNAQSQQDTELNIAAAVNSKAEGPEGSSNEKMNSNSEAGSDFNFDLNSEHSPLHKPSQQSEPDAAPQFAAVMTSAASMSSSDALLTHEVLEIVNAKGVEELPSFGRPTKSDIDIGDDFSFLNDLPEVDSKSVASTHEELANSFEMIAPYGAEDAFDSAFG